MGSLPPDQTQQLGSYSFTSPYTATYDLSTYFSDPQGSALSYWIASNPKANATLSGSTLSVTGGWTQSNAYAYGIVVTASNAFGQTSSETLSVTQAGTAAPSTTLAALGSVTLTSNAVTYALSGSFSDAQGSALYYWLSANPYSSATVAANGTLTVTGAYRGVGPYTVSALASNVYGQASATPASVTVTETSAGTPGVAVYPPAPLTALSTAVSGVAYGAGTYAVTSSDFAAGSTPYGAFTPSASSNPPAYIVENRSSLGTVAFSNVGSNTYTLSSYFTNPLSIGTLTYSLATNPLGTASINPSTGVLTVGTTTDLNVGGLYAGARYPVTVVGSSAGAMIANTLNVVEAVAPRATSLQLGSNVNLSNVAPITLTLKNYFYDTMQTGLSYWLTTTAPSGYSSSTNVSSATSNVTLSSAAGTLTVQSRATGQKFVANVAASNAYGLFLTAALSFVEQVQVFNLTTAGATGQSGPTLASITTAYSSQPWWSTGFVGMSSTQGYQTFTVPTTGTYTITAAGAAGGSANGYAGGQGAIVCANVVLTQGQVLKIAVGQQGGSSYGQGSYVSQSYAWGSRVTGPHVGYFYAAWANNNTSTDVRWFDTDSTSYNSYNYRQYTAHVYDWVRRIPSKPTYGNTQLPPGVSTPWNGPYGWRTYYKYITVNDYHLVNNTNYANAYAGTGGGGTFVVSGSTPLIIAGGGGGAVQDGRYNMASNGYNASAANNQSANNDSRYQSASAGYGGNAPNGGGGGGGFKGNGANNVAYGWGDGLVGGSIQYNMASMSAVLNGGFGGGSASVLLNNWTCIAGAGGGYTGGTASGYSGSGGGGGGCYYTGTLLNAGTQNAYTTTTYNSGDGYCTIAYLSS